MSRSSQRWTGRREGLAERVGEGSGFGGLGAYVAGEVERIAEDDGGAAEFAEQAAERFQVLLCVFAHQSEHGLRGQAQLVGDGDADAAGAEIEAQAGGVAQKHRSVGRQRESRILEWVRESKEHNNRRYRFSLLRRLVLLLLLVAWQRPAAVAFALLVPAGPRTETFVDILPGTSSLQIAAQLKQQGIIRSEYVFLGLRVWKGGTLKAGEYRFDHPCADGRGMGPDSARRRLYRRS